MDILELVLIGFSLAMDAFAVSLCKGLSFKSSNNKKTIILGLYFGIFQSLMPLIGYFLGRNFRDTITTIDHYIVLFLLSFIGFNMIIDSRKNVFEVDNNTSFKTMFPLALATSIDALAVGISFAFLKVDITLAITIIGIITFILSFIAAKIGCFCGDKLGNKAQLIGGITLILLGIKVLLEHLHIMNP